MGTYSEHLNLLSSAAMNFDSICDDELTAASVDLDISSTENLNNWVVEKNCSLKTVILGFQVKFQPTLKNKPKEYPQQQGSSGRPMFVRTWCMQQFTC